MKIKIAGNTPMARLTNLTRGVMAVPKDDIAQEDKKWQKARPKPRTIKRAAS